MGTLKRNQQTEKKKNAQMLEEARKREVLMDGDASQLKVSDFFDFYIYKATITSLYQPCLVIWPGFCPIIDPHRFQVYHYCPLANGFWSASLFFQSLSPSQRKISYSFNVQPPYMNKPL